MLEFRRAKTPQEMEQIQRLRFRVYCLEKQFLPVDDYKDGIESDEFDPYSVHFLAVESENHGEILGTMRLILDSENGFPVEKHFKLSRPVKDRSGTVELSRLIVAREAQNLSALILMGLFREVYLYSKEHEIDDCYAVLEESLLRLLTRFGLPFEEVGEKSWYYNTLNSPVFLSVSNADLVLERNNALFYAYLQEPKGVASGL